MEYKYVDISKTVSIPVPKGLTPDEEANFVAARVAFVNFDELEAQCREGLRLSDENKLPTLSSVLDEIEKDADSGNGKSQ